jgi:hypothetical protein
MFVVVGVGVKRSAIDEMGNDLKRFHPTEIAHFQVLKALERAFVSYFLSSNIKCCLPSQNQLSSLGLSNASLSNTQLQSATQIPGLTLVPSIVGKG